MFFALATLHFTVPHRPIPKERPRLGRGRRVFTPARTKAYESMVGYHAQLAIAGDETPWCKTAEYTVTIACYFKPGPVPDIDNLAKSCLDGMNGVVWDDDRQVTYLTVFRLTDRNERAEITVERTSEPKQRKQSKPRAKPNVAAADKLMGVFGLKRVKRARKRRRKS